MTTRDQWQARERAEALGIIDTINRERGARGYSLREFADVLEQAGWPIGFGTLAGVLSGRKRQSFGVTELRTFAEALDVPVSRLIPDLFDHDLVGLRAQVRVEVKADLLRALGEMK